MNKVLLLRVVDFSCPLITREPKFRSKLSSFDRRRGWPGAFHHHQVNLIPINLHRWLHNTITSECNTKWTSQCHSVNWVISSTIGFIFGDSPAIIQQFDHIEEAMDIQQNTITAHGRSNIRETTGVVIQNCRIVPEQLLPYWNP
ncbi:pectinesterase-like [Olea europaea subsp. europaea]|uniref:Pectinesterase-like n=1 Tax=Olea europaea subsp. europaea TaxID=158383 RepID=A0A8S0VJD5_OLEEU|nr:pectinesterase-like [Olea europaea subsp. europaea]